MKNVKKEGKKKRKRERKEMRKGGQSDERKCPTRTNGPMKEK